MVKIFDLALKEEKGGNLSDEYECSDGSIYTEAYYTNDEWCKFKNSMKANHSTAYAQFENGNGKELQERTNKNGKKMPPKMASYASSSRFVFEKFKDFGDAFEYEYKLANGFRGGPASLDGYMESKRIFVEAKCHEIYNDSSTKYATSYKDFYEYLKKNTAKLYYSTYSKKKKEIEYVLFKWGDLKIEVLDLKQLLCHMLGIAKKALLDDSNNISTLIYLVYYPTDGVLDKIREKKVKYRELIRERWEKVQEEAESIDFKLLYRHIVQYVFDEKKDSQKKYSTRVEKIAELFEFKFCDQRDYLDIVNKIEEIK